MRLNKLTLLSGAAPIALAFGLASSPALAFETVAWSWDKTVTENVQKDVTVTIDVQPTGMVEIEKLQVNLGDVTATSIVSGVENNQPFLGGTASVDEDFDAVVGYFDNGAENPISGATFTPVDGSSDLAIALNPDPNGKNDENANELTFTINVSGDVQVDEGPQFDAATELASVDSSATAVANNQSINSVVSVELHDGQFALGEFSGDVSQSEGGNSNIDLAMAALNGASPASISAVSDVSDILNASVSSSATAVANNMNVSLEGEAANQMMIADITQVAVANTTASSFVSGVSLNNYTNLASVSPIVSSSATAVGNNLSVSVSSPVAP